MNRRPTGFKYIEALEIDPRIYEIRTILNPDSPVRLGWLIRGRITGEGESVRLVDLNKWFVLGHELQPFRRFEDAVTALRDHWLYIAEREIAMTALSINDARICKANSKLVKSKARGERRHLYERLEVADRRGPLADVIKFHGKAKRDRT